MNTETHHQLVSDIVSICNLLHEPYKRKEHCKVSRLTEHRQALITSAVTGKIDMREAST